MDKVWFVTGATRGLGAQIVKAVLAAGDCVVATGRDITQWDQGCDAPQDRLLRSRLDVTDAQATARAADAALEQFGRDDVLVNNAGYG